VTDVFNDLVQVFDSAGNYQFQFGSEGSLNGQFNTPNSVTVDDTGQIYVTDQSPNHRVQVFDSAGNFRFKFGSMGSGNGQFVIPIDVAIVETGDIYVADHRNNRVQVFDSLGNYQFQFGSEGSGNGEFDSPWGIDVDDTGSIYVSDEGNDRVQVWQIVPEPSPPGDYNYDGTVDAADYTIYRDNLGSTTDLRADGTGPGGVPDGIVDQLDYDFWVANFGNTSGSGSLSDATVPEPATALLIIMASVAVCLRRRSRA
jgi:DNA-binding beta-propeller fold protein YncE